MESTIAHLERVGDLRTLICFVERWGEIAEPSPVARIAQARALVHFSMMDRAWSRLRTLVETGEGGVDAYAVAATMFINRGWNGRARRALKKAMEIDADSPVINALWDQAAEAPNVPDLATLEMDDPEPSQLLAAAEHLMATGSFLKARGALERLKRRNYEAARVDDLLWVMKGDFTLQGTLADLADRHGTALRVLPEIGDDDEREHTAELRGGPSTVERELEPSSFPSLFRHMEPATEAWTGREEKEVTQVAAMADLQAMHDEGGALATADGAREDTQIVRVVRRGTPPNAAPRHLGPEPEPQPQSSFDLGAIAQSDAEITGELGLEAEDDDLIVHTRREITEKTEQSTDVSRLRVDSSEELPRPQRHLVDEAAAWVRPQETPDPAKQARRGKPPPAPAASPPPRAPLPPSEPRPPEQPTIPPVMRRVPVRPNWPMWLASVAAVLLLATSVVALLVVYQVALLFLGAG